MRIERPDPSGRRILCLLPVLVGLAAGPCPGQNPPDMTQILQRLEKLEAQNQELLAEVRALKSEIEKTRAAEPAAATSPPLAPAESSEAPAATVDERLKVQEARIQDLDQTKVEASQRFPIRLTGMALFNTYYNAGPGGGSEYPTIAVPNSYSNGGATFRQTTLGLEYRGPATFLGGKVHGNLWMDFFGGGDPTVGGTVRLRTASVELDWNTRSFLAGLDKPIFAPRDPTSLAQVGVSPLTGAGNLWLWIPQARFEQDLRLGENTGLRAQFGVVQTREGYYSGGTSPGYASELEPTRPGAEGRLEFFHGTTHRIEIAPGFHVSTSHVAEAAVPSRVFSADWLFGISPSLDLTGAFFNGQNVAHLGTGAIHQGFLVLAPGFVRPVHSEGGWAQLAWRTTPRLSFHFFSGQQDDRNSDLLAGQIGKNLAYGANVFYRLAPNVIMALEASQLRTNYIGKGWQRTNHYDLALGYLF